MLYHSGSSDSEKEDQKIEYEREIKEEGVTLRLFLTRQAWQQISE